MRERKNPRMEEGKGGYGETSDPVDHSHRNKVTPAVADDAFLAEEDEDYDELYSNICIGPGFLQPLPLNKASGVKNNEVEHKKPPQPPPLPLLPVQNAGGVSLPGAGRGISSFFLGELHWWTTDADVEFELCKYGKVREVTFFYYNDCGKSRGYCQVEFYDPLAAAACMKGLIGHEFNGRPCIVSLSRKPFIHMDKPEVDNQGKNELDKVWATKPGDGNCGRGGIKEGGDGNCGRGGIKEGGDGNCGRGGIKEGGDGDNRGKGRGNWGRGNNLGMGNRGRGNPMRNQGGGMGGRSIMMGVAAPRMLFRPPMCPMGRMGGYAGFPGGPIPVLPSDAGVGLHGLAPYVNHSFYERGVPMHGMGMIPPSGMYGPNMGMWPGPDMGRWDGDEYGGGKVAKSGYGEEATSDNRHHWVDHDRDDLPNAMPEKDRAHEIYRYVPSENDWEHDNHRDRERGRDRDWHRENRDKYADHHRFKDDAPQHNDEWGRGRPSRTREYSHDGKRVV